MSIIDITLTIHEDMVTYSGNPRPEIKQYRQLPADSTTESRICLGSHTGTHVDAPSHVIEDGEDVDELSLDSFYGPARVIDLTGCRDSVDRADLERCKIDEDIVLLKTGNAVEQYGSFRDDFTYLTREAVEYLIEQRVKTVAIDYISLTAYDGGEADHEAHRRANEEMTVIEGVDLRDVEPGGYVFSGMPLKMGTDGAPLRAVLITEE